MHHGERQRGIRARADQQDLVRPGGGFRLPNIDRHDLRAALLRRDQVPRRVWLTRQIGTPEDNERGILVHVFFRVGLERAGEAHAEPAEPPADHRRGPVLAAVEIGEARQHLRARGDAVVVGEVAVSGPDARSQAAGTFTSRGDEIERFVPACLPPGVFGPALADQRLEEPLRVVDDLPRGLAANAEETLAVGVVLVALDADELAVLHIDAHAAERRVAAHRAHRRNRSDRPAHSASSHR